MSLQDQLALADKLLIDGEDEIMRQRHIVARLERDGCKTIIARRQLKTMEYLQSERLVTRNELLAAAALEGMALEEASTAWPSEPGDGGADAPAMN